MTTDFKVSKPQYTKATTIVERIKKITKELVAAISEDDCLNTFCFDGATTERAKVVECAKKRYNAVAEECDNLSDQLDSVRKRLHDIDTDYQVIHDENKSLNNMINSLKSSEYPGDVNPKSCNDSRLKLKLYKLMTGVHFDLNVTDKELSGYYLVIAVEGDRQHYSGLVPFTFVKEQDNITNTFWEKIGEALQTSNDALIDETTTLLQQKLEIK